MSNSEGYVADQRGATSRPAAPHRLGGLVSAAERQGCPHCLPPPPPPPVTTLLYDLSTLQAMVGMWRSQRDRSAWEVVEACRRCEGCLSAMLLWIGELPAALAEKVASLSRATDWSLVRPGAHRQQKNSSRSQCTAPWGVVNV